LVSTTGSPILFDVEGEIDEISHSDRRHIGDRDQVALQACLDRRRTDGRFW
jgi:hypothetical protein